jgi:hypothetical protein
MKRISILLLTTSLAFSGCASSGRAISTPAVAAQASGFDSAVMAEYIRKLPVGSRVRIDLVGGKVLRARLMKVDADPIVVQRRTRVPEPPEEIAISRIRAVEVETDSGGTGRAVGAAVAAGAGSAIGVLLLLAAIFSD